MLYDNHGRKINYLRLAVTDRCNLRCFYCMPEKGIDFVKRQELLSYEEMERVVRVFAKMGINKVRLTGGEPFVRKGLMDFLWKLSEIEGLDALHLTTNGTLTAKLVPDLKALGITSVNLSIDSLDADRFKQITRRDSYEQVMETFHQLLENGIETKLNAVVMHGQNIDDIIPIIELTKEKNISVRFLEEMPFNGTGKKEDVKFWNQADILNHIKSHYSNLVKLQDPPHSTSQNYQVPGYAGSLGIIASYSRLFCGSCNRIRLTPTGTMKTCLYDNGVFNIKKMMRAGATDQDICTALLEALGNRAKDGFEAEGRRPLNNDISESMATIGG